MTAGPITVIHNRVNLQRFNPAGSVRDHAERAALRRALGVGMEDVALFCVGNFRPIKGQGVLKDVLPGQRARASQAREVFVGGGKDRAQALEHAACFSLADGAIFSGVRSDIPDVLRPGELFVLSPSSEGFSNAVIEAMATALSVVATDVGGHREAIPPETGSVVPVGDPGRLAQALLPWCLEGARACTESRFGLDRTVEAYMNAQRESLDVA